MAQKQRLLVRYYLWAADGPWRLPNRLHQDLIDREVAFPQYASTKQKVLEVFARRIYADTFSLRGRGSIFLFDENGFLDRVPAEELVGSVAERALRKRGSGKIVNIQPELRDRRFRREHFWKPTQSMLRLVATDLKKGPRHVGAQRVRVLRRPDSRSTDAIPTEPD